MSINNLLSMEQIALMRLDAATDPIDILHGEKAVAALRGAIVALFARHRPYLPSAVMKQRHRAASHAQPKAVSGPLSCVRNARQSLKSAVPPRL